MDAHAPLLDQKRRVLVIEDTDTTRHRIAHTLRTHGYIVDESGDGLDALQKMSGNRFDAILLDLLLPRLDGWRFREVQLRHAELARIPTIVVTVRELREPDRYALRVADVVQKPFEDAALVRVVAKACGASSSTELSRPPQDAGQLFWSRRGEICCWEHTPKDDPHRWQREGWAAIPSAAAKHRIVYQCQRCPGRRGPIGHRRRSQQ